ncbi:MAG: hypothetical protein LBV12_00785, partial [Puniceicoccales bacterium]|nr:hypothetical protein [Puniceicoccales bacterium]
QEWAEATQPARAWTPRTNDTLGIEYERRTKPGEKQEIIITTKDLDVFGRLIPRSRYVELIKANANNTAVLPDGTTLRLGEVIAYPGGKKPPLIFKLSDGISTQVETSTTPLLNHGFGMPFPALQFTLNQTPSDTISSPEFTLYESFAHHFSGTGVHSQNTLVTYNIPYMPQSPLSFLLQCDFGGTQQFIIPAMPGSFAEKDGYVIRYCDNFVRKATEAMASTVYSGIPQTGVSAPGSTISIQNRSVGTGITTSTGTDHRIFIFTYAIGPQAILSAEAILENGDKIALPVVFQHGFPFCAFQGPEETPSPIHSFILTLSKHSARVAFTIPQIQELWPTQNVKNRFDLRFSATEAAQFKDQMQIGYGFQAALYRLTGTMSFDNLETPNPALDFANIDLTGKTVREAFVLCLQQYGVSPDDYTTSFHQNGRLVFERRKTAGVYIWRWLYRKHPYILQQAHKLGLSNWLRKIGIHEG